MFVFLQKMSSVSDGSHSDASDQDGIPETTAQTKCLEVRGTPIKTRCPKRKSKPATWGEDKDTVLLTEKRCCYVY